MCEEGNLPVCHFSRAVVHFLCLQEMTSITLSHARLDPRQSSWNRERACVCVFVQLLFWLLCFRYSCMQTCMSACVGFVHTCVCTSISLTDLWLMWVAVCSPASLSHRWSHIIPREPWCREPSLFLPTRGCVSQLVQMMQNVPVSPKRCQVPSG